MAKGKWVNGWSRERDRGRGPRSGSPRRAAAPSSCWAGRRRRAFLPGPRKSFASTPLLEWSKISPQEDPRRSNRNARPGRPRGRSTSSAEGRASRWASRLNDLGFGRENETTWRVEPQGDHVPEPRSYRDDRGEAGSSLGCGQRAALPTFRLIRSPAGGSSSRHTGDRGKGARRWRPPGTSSASSPIREGTRWSLSLSLSLSLFTSMPRTQQN